LLSIDGRGAPHKLWDIQTTTDSYYQILHEQREPKLGEKKGERWDRKAKKRLVRTTKNYLYSRSTMMLSSWQKELYYVP